MQADYEMEIAKAIEQVVRQTSYEAKVAAPKDKSALHHSITPLYKGPKGEVWVKSEYGAFVEFGTGSKVSIPSGYESVAAPFKGRGFTGIKPVFLGTKIGWRMIQFPVSVRARPYLIPAFERNSKLFIKDMDRRIDKIANRNWR